MEAAAMGSARFPEPDGTLAAAESLCNWPGAFHNGAAPTPQPLKNHKIS